MKVTQTIQLQDDERLAIEKVLGLCDEIADIAHCSAKAVFNYLAEEAEIVADYTYCISNMLEIAEIG